MNPLDQALQSLMPVVKVPRHEAFEVLQKPGQRFVVAEDGMWLEIRRAWMYARVKIANQPYVVMPFGRVEPVLEMTCGPVPAALMQQFTQQALQACPLETAAWVVWNEHTCQFDLRQVVSKEASAAHIHFERPRLVEGEHLVLDLHSHGQFAAGFSATDNADDRGEVKVALVIGHCDQPRRSFATRFCLNGRFIPLKAVSEAAGWVGFKETCSETLSVA